MPAHPVRTVAQHLRAVRASDKLSKGMTRRLPFCIYLLMTASDGSDAIDGVSTDSTAKDGGAEPVPGRWTPGAPGVDR